MNRTEVEQIMAGAAKLVLEETEPMPSAADMALSSGITEKSMVLDDADQAALRKGLDMISTAQEDTDPEMMAEGIQMVDEIISGSDPATKPSSTDSEQEEPTVVRLRIGEFKDADSFHRGSGQATIYSAPGGDYLLRLENLDVTNGPALHVYLSTHNDPTRSDEVKLPGYLDLGKLKGNRGDQNYTIPGDADISKFNSVVIYCKPFAVVFSVATLSDA